MEPAIRTERLTKIYGQRLIAVNDMNLEVPTSSVFGLLGPNGAGKTTTLRLLLGLQRPTAGCAQVFGKKCGPNAVAVRASIGYLPTNPRLPGNLRPIEYLDLLGRLSRMPDEVRMLTTRERECLEMLAIGRGTAEIAQQYDVSVSTVHTYMKRAREKLHLSSMEQLIAFSSRYLPPKSNPKVP